jgi:acyl-CoA thioesterase I
VARFIFVLVAASFLIFAGYSIYLFWPQTPINIAVLTNYPPQGTDIIAFGDSLVYGYGADDGKDFVSLLSNDINQPIVNLGKDGDTTDGALNRLDDLDRYDPKVVILLVGGNDYLQNKDMTVAFQNLGSIIDAIQKRGAVVVLVGVRANYFVGNFDKQYQALVSQYKVAYVPNAVDGILGNPKLMFDNIHPNNDGYQLLADRIEPVLKEVLR